MVNKRTVVVFTVLYCRNIKLLKYAQKFVDFRDDYLISLLMAKIFEEGA